MQHLLKHNDILGNSIASFKEFGRDENAMKENGEVAYTY